MEIIDVALKPPYDTKPLVLVIGKFDGIHKGHQLILQTAREYTVKDELLTVLSFTKNPQKVLENEDYVIEKKITLETDKLSILKKFGVERYYRVVFTKEYAKTTAEEFIFEHLGRINVKRIVVGEDFRFGQGRKAGISELITLCTKRNIAVTVVPLDKEDGADISSTMIRNLIVEGKVERAKMLLGRPYRVTGEVIHGNALGRTLGFPTANLGGIDMYVLPKPGVYLGRVEIFQDEIVKETKNALISAGYRPTVAGDGYLFEAYLMDFTGDLYGKKLAVSFNNYLREEIKFEGIDALVRQMHQDKEEAQKLLTGIPPEKGR